MSADRTSANLGAVALGGATTQTVLTLTNTATQPLRLGTARVAGPQAGEFALAGDTCSASEVRVGGACSITARFAPDAIGPRNASLTIPEGGDVTTVALAGVGTAPPPPAAPAPAPTPSGGLALQPTADTTSPLLTLRGLPTRVTRANFRRKGLRMTVETDEPASVTGVLMARVSRRGKSIAFQSTVGNLEIGSRSLQRGTGRRSLVLKSSSRFAKAVRNRRLRLTVRITATDAAGNGRVTSRSVRVR